MKLYARIENGVVAELFETAGDIALLFAPGLTWVDVTGLAAQPQQNWTYDGKAFAAPVVPVVPLTALQSSACNQIDAAAGTQRGKYTTQVAGQNEVYQLKLNEAQAYQKATSPVATDYPHLNAEATQTSTPIATVAQNVINTYNQWVPISAKIEGYRLGGKAAVNAATDAAGVQSALNKALANLESC